MAGSACRARIYSPLRHCKMAWPKLAFRYWRNLVSQVYATNISAGPWSEGLPRSEPIGISPLNRRGPKLAPGSAQITIVRPTRAWPQIADVRSCAAWTLTGQFRGLPHHGPMVPRAESPRAALDRVSQTAFGLGARRSSVSRPAARSGRVQSKKLTSDASNECSVTRECLIYRHEFV